MTTHQNISGYINLNKPIGITSMEAVRRIKQSLPRKTKVGHAGTLDPLAQGVLPICIGTATRLMEYVVSGRKVYLTELKLGYISDTYDSEGTITAGNPNLSITLSDIRQTLPLFIVTIHSIDILQCSYPLLTLSVTCGSGVYIRSLAFDIGNTLESGAYVTTLIRQRSGSFTLSESIPLSDLQNQDTSLLASLMKPIDFALEDLPSSHFSDTEAVKLMQGQTISSQPESKSSSGSDYRAYNNSFGFFGITRLIDSVWHPVKILAK